MPRTPPAPVSYLAASEPQSDRAARAAARLLRFDSETPSASELGDGYAASPSERLPSPIPEEDEAEDDAVVVTEVVPPKAAGPSSRAPSSESKTARWDAGYKALGFDSGAALAAARELELLIAVNEDLKTEPREGQVNACYAFKDSGNNTGLISAWKTVRDIMASRDVALGRVRLWEKGVLGWKALRDRFTELMNKQRNASAPKRTGVRTEVEEFEASAERRKLLADLFTKWDAKRKEYDRLKELDTQRKVALQKEIERRREMVRALAMGRKNLANDLDAVADSPDDCDSSPPPPSGPPTSDAEPSGAQKTTARAPKRARTTSTATESLFLSIQKGRARKEEATEARHKAILDVKERQLGLEEKRLELDDKKIMLDAKRLEEPDKLKDMVVELQAGLKDTQREFQRNLA